MLKLRRQKMTKNYFQPRLPLGVQNAAQNVKFLCFMRLPNRRGHERQTIFQRPIPIRERATITKLNEKEFPIEYWRKNEIFEIKF